MTRNEVMYMCISVRIFKYKALLNGLILSHVRNFPAIWEYVKSENILPGMQNVDFYNDTPDFTQPRCQEWHRLSMHQWDKLHERF